MLYLLEAYSQLRSETATAMAPTPNLATAQSRRMLCTELNLESETTTQLRYCNGFVLYTLNKSVSAYFRPFRNV